MSTHRNKGGVTTTTGSSAPRVSFAKGPSGPGGSSSASASTTPADASKPAVTILPRPQKKGPAEGWTTVGHRDVKETREVRHIKTAPLPSADTLTTLDVPFVMYLDTRASAEVPLVKTSGPHSGPGLVQAASQAAMTGGRLVLSPEILYWTICTVISTVLDKVCVDPTKDAIARRDLLKYRTVQCSNTSPCSHGVRCLFSHTASEYRHPRRFPGSAGSLKFGPADIAWLLHGCRMTAAVPDETCAACAHAGPLSELAAMFLGRCTAKPGPGPEESLEDEDGHDDVEYGHGHADHDDDGEVPTTTFTDEDGVVYDTHPISYTHGLGPIGSSVGGAPGGPDPACFPGHGYYPMPWMGGPGSGSGSVSGPGSGSGPAKNVTTLTSVAVSGTAEDWQAVAKQLEADAATTRAFVDPHEAPAFDAWTSVARRIVRACYETKTPRSAVVDVGFWTELVQVYEETGMVTGWLPALTYTAADGSLLGVYHAMAGYAGANPQPFVTNAAYGMRPDQYGGGAGSGFTIKFAFDKVLYQLTQSIPGFQKTGEETKVYEPVLACAITSIPASAL